jgi:hypothetical protein
MRVMPDGAIQTSSPGQFTNGPFQGHLTDGAIQTSSPTDRFRATNLVLAPYTSVTSFANQQLVKQLLSVKWTVEAIMQIRNGIGAQRNTPTIFSSV